MVGVSVIEMRRCADLIAPAGFPWLKASSVTSDQRMLGLWVKEGTEAACCVTIQDEDDVVHTAAYADVLIPPAAFVRIAQVGSTIILASSGAGLILGSTSHDVLVLDMVGNVVRYGSVGRGVGTIFSRDDNEFWVSYGEEAPIARQVLRRASSQDWKLQPYAVASFGSDLSWKWKFPASGGPQPWHVYALNVGTGGVSFYFYDELFIAKIERESIAYFKTGGVQALATTLVVDENIAMLVGGVEGLQTGTIGLLSDGEFEPIAAVRIDEPELSLGAMFGVGNELWVRRNLTWYVWTLDSKSWGSASAVSS